MATWWVSTTGSQTNSGTNYANAWQNVEEIAYKVRGVGSQGDTVNVVNDGTYVLTAQGADYINSFAGTNFTDNWGLRIRGTDSSGNPEMAHCKIPNTNGTYAMYRAQVGSVYFIMEGLHFYCATGCDVNANLSIILIDGANVGTSPAWLFRSCSFDWGLEAVPRGRRNVVELNTSDSGKYYFDHCYYGGGEAIMEDGGVAVCTPDGVDLTRCIFVQNESNIAMQVIEGVIQAGNVFSATHNTFVNLYTNTVTRIQGPIQAMVLNSEGANASTGTVKDNLYYTGVRGDGSNIATKWEFTNLFAQITPHSNVFNTSDIGYNGWVGQTNVVSDATPNPYRPPFSASNTSPIKATDLLTFATSSADVFNDVTAAYSWTAGSYTIDLPRDLRPMLGSLLTAASDGGYVGALEGANSAPVAGPVSYNVTVGDTLVTTATDGVLSNTTDPDLDTLTASVVAAPSHASAFVFNTTTGGFSYTPNTTYGGTDTFTFKASDGTTWSNVSTATIDIANQTPTGQNQTYSVEEGVTLSVVAASGMLTGASDPEGLTVSATSVTAPANGTLTSYNTTTGSFVYQPDSFFTGSDNFTFKITDGFNLSVAYNALIAVNGVSTPSITNVIDTAPFFKPDLRVATEIRFKVKKNRRKHHDLPNYTEGELWEESTHRVIALATNTTTQVTLGGVDTAEYLMVETDQPINVSVNDALRYWTVSGAVAVALTEVSTIYLQNESTTNAAQVILVVAD